LHAILAGFLAGSIYFIKGNKIFIFNAITTILQILAMYGVSKKIIPHPSMLGGLTFAFCNAALFHSMLTNHKITPALFYSFINVLSSGYAGIIHQQALKIVYGLP
ncbi:hypothetical protein L9F63_025899, partial [Diploptera punctata]